jgi:hypothetical protein
MMREGTQYTHSRRRVLFTNALSEKMLGQNPEKAFSARDGAYPASLRLKAPIAASHQDGMR